ncbi:MAG: 3-oxoacyl-[acyl-carrier-protein] reductase [Fretibacterium sp.]|nr:3-oxoacyl-[acyl-carrier-protein] reductase [Fretibacterium sp.]
MADSAREPRLALVTGGARGIGRAVALELARGGYNVAVNFRSSAEAAAALVKELESLGVRAGAFQADVSNREQVEVLFKRIREALGPVGVLVNNAGITHDTLLMRMKAEDWDAVLSANLSSAFYCTKEAVRDMARAKWGRIVTISSVVGITGNAGQANYAASKAGLIGFTKSVAREYAARGITANAVAPGFIDTSMTEVLKDDVKAAISAQIPEGHIGTPEDVARAVAFFAHSGSAYITGQVLAVDGGLTMC